MMIILIMMIMMVVVIGDGGGARKIGWDSMELDQSARVQCEVQKVDDAVVYDPVDNTTEF